MALITTNPNVNKHHLLYPETAYTNCKVKDIIILRDFFVVETPKFFHSDLHQELDSKHGISIAQIQIGPEYLPDESTLEKLIEAFKAEKATKLDGNRTPEDYLSWLIYQIPYDSNHKDCWWISDQLRDQLAYFKNHPKEARLRL